MMNCTVKCPVAFSLTQYRTDEITSLHLNYQHHGSAEIKNSSAVGNFRLYV